MEPKSNVSSPQIPDPAPVTPQPVSQSTSPSDPSKQASTPPLSSASVPSQNHTPTSHTVITILLLIFLPLIGVIVMFIITKWPKWVKALVTFIFLLVPFLAIIFSIILISINPARQFGQANNTVRQSDVTQILNAVGAYSAANGGSLPSGISSTPQEISSNGADLCKELITTYMPALPTDPLLNSNDIESDCPAGYKTGYEIVLNSDNTVTVRAPSSENGIVISITR